MEAAEARSHGSGAQQAHGPANESAAVARTGGLLTVEGMKPITSLADKKRADHRLAAMRMPVRAPARPTGAGPRRPTVSLADVVRMPGHVEERVCVDATRVQANHRVSLASACEALGLNEGSRLRLHVGDGAVVLEPVGPDANDLTVRVRHQVTLPAAALHALGVGPGDTVVAVVDETERLVRLLGPAAITDGQRLSSCSRPIRDAINQLAPTLTARRLAAVVKLLGRFDDEALMRLADLTPDGASELLAAAGDGSNRERRD